MALKKNCASCGSSNVLLILNLGSTALANSFLVKKTDFLKEKKHPLRLYICKNCKLVQVFHTVKPSEFFINYDYLSGASTTWKSHCKKYTDHMIKDFNLKKENGSIIEIASNDGVLIDNFVKKNFKCIGIEPSVIAHKIALKKGIKSINKFFNLETVKKIKKQDTQLIIANNVIAHVKNINNFVKAISKITNDKTIITIEFPYVYNLKIKNQFDTIYHEHHYYYSLHSISKLFERHNLKIFDTEKIKIHGGSYRVFVKRKSSKRSITQRYKNLLSYEKNIKLNNIHFYKNFQNKVNNVKLKANKLIKSLLNQNKIIHAYGAAAKGNTFLNFCNLKDNQINFIYEFNETKVGKYLPGSHIKILSHKDIKKYKPNYIIVLPWNIFEEIKEQLKYTKKWGCKLIRFLPTTKIVI